MGRWVGWLDESCAAAYPRYCGWILLETRDPKNPGPEEAPLHQRQAKSAQFDTQALEDSNTWQRDR